MDNKGLVSRVKKGIFTGLFAGCMSLVGAGSVGQTITVLEGAPGFNTTRVKTSNPSTPQGCPPGTQLTYHVGIDPTTGIDKMWTSCELASTSPAQGQIAFWSNKICA